MKAKQVLGVKIPVPKPSDLAVLKMASSVTLARNPLKARYDRKHALDLIERFSITRDKLKERAKAMGCLENIERFFGQPTPGRS